MLTPEARALLADPAVSLPAYGTVVDQETGELRRYDPYAMTEKLQSTVIGYVSDPPRDGDGFAKWLSVLKSRQSGCSTTGTLALYPKVAYNPGVEAAIIADNQDRANGLFDRLMLNHRYWPEDIRVEQQSTNEVRSFTTKDQSRVRVLSGHSDAVGIGRSIDILMASELAFWANASLQFSMLTPALINRKNALVIQECTPAPMSESSAQFWHDQCSDAMMGRGRYLFAFFPFWDSKLCRRAWPKGQMPDQEEHKLLERFGSKGLSLDNLQFRRVMMDSDPEIRRNPALFGVYYPFDPVSCWISSGTGIIPGSTLDKFLDLRDERDGLTIFEEPKPQSQYILAVDPSGWGRDHAAFQILEIWADEWRQVASYGQNVDPNEFADLLFKMGVRYNMATIAVERNGVGAAPIALLRQMKYPRLFHDKVGKPGIHKANHDEWVSLLVDALLDKLVLVGMDTVNQIRGYRGDKVVERSVRAELLATNNGRRRARHHWDKVSALMVACAVAPYMPIRYKPTPKPDNVLLFGEMTWEQQEKYRLAVQAQNDLKNRKASGRRTHYRRRK